jgi:hypothetical protein
VLQDNFEHECDRLSHDVDSIQFERLRWARTEAPMLAQLVDQAQTSIDAREDFELSEEGSTLAVKRFILKVHGNRIAALSIGLENPQVKVSMEAIGRSKFTVAAGDPISADFGVIDAAWMAATLSQLIRRIES